MPKSRDLTGLFLRSLERAARAHGVELPKKPWTLHALGNGYTVRVDGDKIGKVRRTRTCWSAEHGSLRTTGFRARDDAARWVWQQEVRSASTESDEPDNGKVAWKLRRLGSAASGWRPGFLVEVDGDPIGSIAHDGRAWFGSHRDRLATGFAKRDDAARWVWRLEVEGGDQAAAGRKSKRGGDGCRTTT